MIDSYKSLLPDSGSNVVTILTQISQQLSNGSQISSQATVPPFQPPTSAVWVNALWFLSLVISLFCALLATLQQYWARRYLRLTQTQSAIHKRARFRSFFAEGVARFHLAFAVETIPALLHISMFLFLTGLVISLFSIHHTIAIIVLAATVVGGFLYMVITVMPVIYHNSPYQSPLSALAWDLPRRAAKALLSAAWHIVSLKVSLQKRTGFVKTNYISPLCTRISKCKKRLSVSMARATEEAAAKEHWGIDARALIWTLDKSHEESELEKFIAGIPKFTDSKAVQDPLAVLLEATTAKKGLRPSLYRDIATLLINATEPGLLPNSKELPPSVKERRIRICLEALYFLPGAIEKILRRASNELGNKMVQRGFASFLESRLSWEMALEHSKLTRSKKRNEKFKSRIVAARCVAAVMATRLPSKMWSLILTRQWGIQDPKLLVSDQALPRAPSNSFLLKTLNHFLDNTALNYIDVGNTDILISTVRIIKQKLQLNSAAKKLRVEFGNHVRRLEHLANGPYEPSDRNNVEDDLPTEMVRRKNAKALLDELASLRNPAPPTLQVQTDASTVTPPDDDGLVAMTSPKQFPIAQVSSPPGDVYITMPPYPETPSGETHPLMPHSATLPAIAMPSRESSSGDEE